MLQAAKPQCIIITEIRVSDVPLFKEEPIVVTQLAELSENTTLSKVCVWENSVLKTTCCE
jgi:hypothetical protein